jgi:hypothetical protein
LDLHTRNARKFGKMNAHLPAQRLAGDEPQAAASPARVSGK